VNGQRGIHIRTNYGTDGAKPGVRGSGVCTQAAPEDWVKSR